MLKSKCLVPIEHNYIYQVVILIWYLFILFSIIIKKVVIDENLSTVDFQESLKEIFLKHHDYTKLIIIRSARVPIIKVIETKTNTSFDISLNKTEGLD